MLDAILDLLHTPDELVELPPTASAVQKFIDKNMWQKTRELTKTSKDTQIKKEESENEDEGLQKCKCSLGPSKPLFHLKL